MSVLWLGEEGQDGWTYKVGSEAHGKRGSGSTGDEGVDSARSFGIVGSGADHQGAGGVESGGDGVWGWISNGGNSGSAGAMAPVSRWSKCHGVTRPGGRIFLMVRSGE